VGLLEVTKMEVTSRIVLELVIGVALVPIALAVGWAALLCAGRLLPIRWWFSLFSVICLAGFVAILFRLLPDQAMPKHLSPWWLGVGTVFSMIIAIHSWVERRRESRSAAGPIEDERGECVREITGWLQEPVTVQAALKRLEESDRLLADGPSQSLVRQPLLLALLVITGLWVFDLYWRFHDGPRLTAREHFERWYSERAREGDELWWYDSGAKSWEMLAGRCGYAILRDGAVVDGWTLMEN